MLYLEVFFVIFLILLNGVFAMSELAIVSAKKVHLKRLADEGSKAAQIALDFSQDTGRFLPTVQIGITLIGVLSGAFSGATLSEPFTQYLESFGLNNDTAEFISVTSIVLIITYFTLIIGELVPKELALRNPERLALFVAPIIYGLSRLTSPLVTLLDFSCKLVLKAIGAGAKPLTTVTQEEVRDMIEEGTEHGLFHEAERDMISGIMLLSDKPISAFMMPRTDVVTISHRATAEEVKELLADNHYSRYPVKQSGNVIGIIQTKDYLNHVLDGKIWNLDELLQPVPTFPENTPTLSVIEHLRTSPIHMGVIIDEHGTFEGIVTLIDLVEVITGELYAHGEASGEIVQRDKNNWVVDASILLEIAFQKIGITGLPEDNSYHTLAGFMLHYMTYIPKKGDSFEFNGFKFEVRKMDSMRIEKVLISRIISPLD